LVLVGCRGQLWTNPCRFTTRSRLTRSRLTRSRLTRSRLTRSRLDLVPLLKAFGDLVNSRMGEAGRRRKLDRQDHAKA
jgi:hypothetical protein